MISVYLSTQTWLHRVPAAPKLILLLLVSLLVMPVRDWRWLVAGAGLLVICYASLGRPGRNRLLGLKALLPIVIGLGAFQGLVMDWNLAALSVARFVVMIMLADLITVTTPLQEMLAVLMPVLRPLRIFGLDHTRLGLAVALVIRFIPLLIRQWQAQREAFIARSQRRPGMGLLIPFVAQALRRTDQIAESITARQSDRRLTPQ